MSPLRYDPEYYKATEPSRGQPPPPQQTDVLALREANDGFMLAVVTQIPLPEGLTKKIFTIKSHDGVEIDVTRFATEATLSASEPTAAAVYAHGGGFVSGSVEIFTPIIAKYAGMADIPIFAVSYRLAPEHPAPCGVQDVFAAVQHVSEHAKDFNIDPAKIAVLGDSAGGGIAAGTALYARDQGFQPPLAKQILIYPMLDDRTELGKDAALAKFVTWTAGDNLLAWDAYVGKEKRGKPDANVSIYASPARATNLRGLPPTYVEVGTLDLFRDEDVAFVTQLLKDDVEVEFHLMPGLPHGWDSAAGISWVKRSQENRAAAIKSIGV